MAASGAHDLIETLICEGVEVCFANPGTSEMHFVAALGEHPQMRSILCLFEGSVTGAADGYGQMTRKPAATLLHLGPGLANGHGLACLHNAKKAHTPIVNIIGDHATFHKEYDAPLNSDVEGTARPYSHVVKSATEGPGHAADTAHVVAAAQENGGLISCLVLPADLAWSDVHGKSAPDKVAAPEQCSAEALEAAAQAVLSGKRVGLILGGDACFGGGIKMAGQIAAETGATLLVPYATGRIERGRGLPPLDRILAMHRVIDPIGGVHSDMEIFSAIADKLGVRALFDEVRDEMAWLRYIYDVCRSDAEGQHDSVMPDFDTFWNGGSAPVPVEEHHVYLAQFRKDPGTHPLATESGKIVLCRSKLADLGYDDCLAHPTWLHSEECDGDLLSSAKGRFQLISSQPCGRVHSQLEAEPASPEHKRNGREQVSMHPDDAAALDIETGSLVRISNGRGACLAAVQVTANIKQGVASLPMGSWLLSSCHQPTLELSGNPNVVTRDIRSSRFGQGCAARTCMVEIAPEQGTYPNPQTQYLRHHRTLVQNQRTGENRRN